MRRALVASFLLAPMLLAAERPAPPPRPPVTEEQIDRIVDQLRLKFASAKRPAPAARAAGSKAVVVDEKRVHFATASIGTDGKPHVGCAKGAHAAARAVLEEPSSDPAKE